MKILCTECRQKLEDNWYLLFGMSGPETCYACGATCDQKGRDYQPVRDKLAIRAKFLWEVENCEPNGPSLRLLPGERE